MRLGRAGMVLLVLALLCTACTDPDTEDLGEHPEAAANPIPISITDYEIVMPTALPAGPTRFTLNNTGAESCTFTMAPQSAGRMTSGQGPTAPETPPGTNPDQGVANRTGPGAADSTTASPPPSGPAGTDTSGPTPQNSVAPGQAENAARDVARGLTHTVVAAGQHAVRTTNLRPGAYQVWCSETNEAGRRPRAMAQQVMVTAAAAEGAEDAPGQRHP